MQSKIKILLIEDEDFDVMRVKNTIALFDQRIEIKDIVSDGSAALEKLRKKSDYYDLIIMDYQIAGALRGEELIKKLKGIDPAIQIIVITKLTINITDFEFARTLMEAGAFWYCTKYPGDIEEYIYQPTDFLLSIFNAYEKRKLEKERRISDRKLIQNIEDKLKQKQIISVSESMTKLKKDIVKLAQNDFNILVSGDSGTGKELVAHNIHYQSKRKMENFVPINCGSLPPDLIESELFGYEKGAFTDAKAGKEGLFEIADKGTLFLDEIAELPLSAQVKLLRVMQEGEIEKIGRTKSVKVDVRIIAATNKDLEKEVEEKRFRQDLFYRLNVLQVFLLPLRKRKDDIPVLIEHYLSFYASDMGVEIPEITDEAMTKLVEYRWPGNVRELKNVVQRLLFRAEKRVTADDVESTMMIRRSGDVSFSEYIEKLTDHEMIPLKDIEKLFRKEYFEYVRENSASDAEAAKKLGLAPPNYHRMSKELGLK